MHRQSRLLCSSESKNLPSLCLLYTAKKPYHDDSDSGMGSSISTGRKTTTVSEVTLLKLGAHLHALK